MSGNVIHFIVEGQTEEAFVNRLLKDRWPSTVVRPFNLCGSTKYSRFKRTVQILIGRFDTLLVTTMLDYQGLKPDYPGRANSASLRASGDRAKCIEDAMKADLVNTRYIPYIAMHEFEALLFSRPEIIADEVAKTDKRNMATRLSQIRNSKSEYTRTPEEINESAATSPSARIEDLCLEMFGSKRAYQKSLHGPIIASKIGLETMMAECPHFKEWIGKLDAVCR